MRYCVPLYKQIEHMIGKEMDKYETVEEEVKVLLERVTEAQNFAKLEMKELEDKSRRGGRKKRNYDEDIDTEGSKGVKNRMKKKKWKK